MRVKKIKITNAEIPTNEKNTVLLMSVKSPLSSSAMFTETFWLCDSPLKLALTLNACVPSLFGISVIVTVPSSSSFKDKDCGEILTSSAQLSYPDTVISKLSFSPLLIIDAAIISSSPTVASELRDALIDGSGPWQDKISNLIEKSLSKSSSEFSSYADLSNSSPSSSYAKKAMISKSYLVLDNPSGKSMKNVAVFPFPERRESIT